MISVGRIFKYKTAFGKVVCNNLHITTPEYRFVINELAEYILDSNIQYYAGRFVFRHDTVAQNYFVAHIEITPYECLKDLVIYEYMD